MGYGWLASCTKVSRQRETENVNATKRNPNRPLRLCDPWRRPNGRPTIRRIFNRAVRVVTREGLIDEGLSIFPSLTKYNHAEPWGVADDSPCQKTFEELLPGFRCVACFAVTGGSEGHYIHVELLGWDEEQSRRTGQSVGTRVLVFIGKTFQGLAHAQALASRLAVLLGV